MKVVYADDKLSLVETDGFAVLRIPIAVIMAARRKLMLLRAAPDERTLRNWKSLHYEKLKGDREGQRSVRLNDQWRIVFTIDNHTCPPTVKILSIEDYH